MGWDEEVFIVREGYSIAYILYSGSPLTERLEKMSVERLDHKYFRHYNFSFETCSSQKLSILPNLRSFL
jgi:hypothetical protein